MWGVSIIKEHRDEDDVLLGVTVMADNGDTEYMTIESYSKFLRNREKYGKEDKSKSLGKD
jgi:hypothetical protein